MNKLSLFLLFLCTISVKSFAQSIANHAKTDTALVKSFIKKASKFVTLNSDSASYYLNKVDFMTKDYKVSVERSHYLQVLGNQYKFYKKFDEAEKTYEKRLEIAGRLKNREDHVFSSIHALASIYVEKGQYIKAATNYLLLEDRLLNSLAKRPLQNGDLYQESLLFKTYCNLCLVYHRLKNKTRNQYYLKKLSPLIRTASDSLYYYYAMATYLPNERRSQYYLMGLEFAQSKNDTYSIKELNSEFGHWFVLNKDYKNALKHAFISLSIDLKMPDRWQYDYLNFHTIGNAYLHLGYYDKARSFLEKSLKGFDETEQFDNKYAALFDLSELHKKTKDYQKALYYFSYAQSVKDSVIGTDLQNQIGQISSDYELKAKQKQIEVEQKQKRLVYMLLFILLLLFVGIILSYLRAIKVNKLLALKRQKIEEQATLLSESNATKDKLFAMLSHDLRGPINNVVNYLYLLEDNYAPPQSYIDKLRFSLENVQLILNNLFNWAELQIRNSPPTLKHVSVDLVLDKVLQQFDDSIKDKEIKILNSLRGDMVWADENYLQIILRNVISNAMKFTSQKGEIKIETENHKSHTHIIVYDTGVGIAPLQLEKVFNYPTSSVGTKNEKGTGLGLTLCKELMEKQGGTVSISSQLGLGTVVSLRFPFVTRLA